MIDSFLSRDLSLVGCFEHVEEPEQEFGSELVEMEFLGDAFPSDLHGPAFAYLVFHRLWTNSLFPSASHHRPIFDSCQTLAYAGGVSCSVLPN